MRSGRSADILPGTTVQFRVRGVTKAAAPDWSPPISLLVK
jgi:hypothetical protein